MKKSSSITLDVSPYFLLLPWYIKPVSFDTQVVRQSPYKMATTTATAKNRREAHWNKKAEGGNRWGKKKQVEDERTTKGKRKKKQNWNPQKRTFARLNSLLLLRQKEGEKMQFGNVGVVRLSLYTSRQKMIKGANHISLTRPSKRKKTSPHRRIYEKRPKLNQSWGKWKFSKGRKKKKKEKMSPTGCGSIDRCKKRCTRNRVPLDWDRKRTALNGILEIYRWSIVVICTRRGLLLTKQPEIERHSNPMKR
jgi:hypothetical protein